MSECRKMCALDNTRTYCISCKRTLEEIIQRGREKMALKKVLDNEPK